MNRKLAWKPDIPDQRDYTFAKLLQEGTVSAPSTLPPAISLRRWCSEVEDQQMLGSCVANAVVGMFELTRNYKGQGGINFSRLFSYYNARVITENVEEDSGTYIRDAIKTAKLNGICPANNWPYRVNYWKAAPPASAYVAAIPHKVKSYYRINTLEEMKTNLANGHPFAFGFAVYESFQSYEVAMTGMVPMPLQTEAMLGGHAVLAVGYDDSTQKFLVRNSWGKGWGIQEGNLKGYCWFPYEYLVDRNLSDDFWTAF